MNQQLVLLYVPFPNQKSVTQISKLLLEAKLAVCIQTHEVISNYHWENKIQKKKEIIALIKTDVKCRSKAIKCIKQNHPYQVPCIISIRAEVNKKYAAWMQKLLA